MAGYELTREAMYYLCRFDREPHSKTEIRGWARDFHTATTDQ